MCGRWPASLDSDIQGPVTTQDTQGKNAYTSKKPMPTT